MLLAVISLFFAEPLPLEMPRTDAYLVSSPNGTHRLEERLNVLDLWLSQTVSGRWMDARGGVFTLADLAVEPPSVFEEGAFTTRSLWAGKLEKFKLRRSKIPHPEGSFARAVGLISPIEISLPVPAENLPRGYEAVNYWQGSNTQAIVSTYLPEKSPCWRLAVWQLAAGEDFKEAVENFESQFLKGEAENFNRLNPHVPEASLSERELQLDDIRHSVSNYPAWKVTRFKEFAILDNLHRSSAFVSQLTNELALVREKYRRAIDSELDFSNSLSVIRIYRSRDEYLDQLQLEGITNISWSAAYWCQVRRELVAYLPPEGEHKLMQTMRHEAFHQYMSYACSMIPPSPWLNEGYAQYFERDSQEFIQDDGWIASETNALLLPSLMMMDYGEFYAGSDEERRLKYLLAYSIAIFIEKGMQEIRFNPFKNLKRDYVRALLSSRDMRKATMSAFGSEEQILLFVEEWKKFWEGD